MMQISKEKPKSSPNNRLSLAIVRSELLCFLKYQKQRITDTYHYPLTKKLKTFLTHTPPAELPEEDRKQMLAYMRFHLAKNFNYPFAVKYLFRRTKVYFDKGNNLHYIITAENRKLYFRRGASPKSICNSYNYLCMEQDLESPHYYCFDGEPQENTILADIGAAEGNFSLQFIDRMKKVYLFEANQEWIEALEATFQPWKDKVVIVNKYVSNKNDDDCLALDTYFKDKEKPTLLKADVEGAEKDVLEGLSETMNGQQLKDILICTYHQKDDERVLSELLQAKGYATKPSPKFMLFDNDLMSKEPPYDFRHGLLHASK